MPTKRANDDERLARLEHLMEQYRVKHEGARTQIDPPRARRAPKRQAKVVRAQSKLTRAARKKR